MRISDWSSDVCSSDLVPAELADLHQRSVQRQRVEPVDARLFARGLPIGVKQDALRRPQRLQPLVGAVEQHVEIEFGVAQKLVKARAVVIPRGEDQAAIDRSEEHTSELQSLTPISYADL